MSPCPDCGTNIVGRRYPLEPLAEFMGLSIHATCAQLGISGSTQQSARCHGITRNIVDKAARALKEHPSAIWPEVTDHDIEDASVDCANDRCDNRFIPTRKGHRFCTQDCGRRYATRERYRRLYQTDPEFRERELARNVTKRSPRYDRVRHRTYRERNRDKVVEAQRAYRERNRETIREKQREYSARYRERNRARVAAARREYDARPDVRERKNRRRREQTERRRQEAA